MASAHAQRKHLHRLHLYQRLNLDAVRHSGHHPHGLDDLRRPGRLHHNAGSLATAAFTNVSVTPASATRTFAANEDIGQPTPLGTYTESSGTITLTAGGSDIWGTTDQLQYGYNEVTGSGTLTLEVDSISNTNAWTKAGIMLRNTLASNGANVALFVTPGEGIDLQWRTTTGGSTSQTVVSSLTAPYWIRLVDSSNSFTAFYSSNDTTWTQIGSAHSVTMNSDFFAGVALTSHDSGTSATATFNNVTSTFTAATIAPPALTKAAASSANPVTSTYTILSATATDSVEGASNLIFTWSLLGEPPDPVTFSANGTNSAASTTVSFATAGTYLFQVVISDPNGFQTISTVTVAVNQTLSSIAVTPASTSVGPNTADQLTAIALDQFGIPMANQPASFSWSIASGSGTVNSTTGVYTSPAASATATVRAASGSISGTTTLTTTNQPPLIANSTGASASASTVTVGTPVALSVPAVDDGGASNLTYTWTWTGPTVVTFTGNTNGTNVAQNISANFTQPGAYTLTVTVTDSGGLTATSSVPVVVIAPFATQSGSTLNIALNPNGPVSISGSSGTITATQGGVQSTFTGITTIVVTDSGSGDTLDFNGGITTPITFTAAQTSTINVNAGTLNFAGAATISLGALNIASGALAAVPVNSASQTQLLLDSLTINGGALDLTDNEMFITYGSGTTPCQSSTPTFSPATTTGTGTAPESSPRLPRLRQTA